jgi:hypothetical protein
MSLRVWRPGSSLELHRQRMNRILRYYQPAKIIYVVGIGLSIGYFSPS